MSRPIYLDNHSTTAMDPRVFKAMEPYFLEIYGNASQDLHFYNWEAEAALEAARSDLAQLLMAHPKEIIFTSGATESNHLALLGVAPQLKRLKRTKILSIKIEHSSVIAPLEELSKQGFTVEWIPLHADGRVHLEEFKKMLTTEVGLVSIAMANHEVGTIQEVQIIGALCRENKTFFHSDAVQALGKLRINVQEMNLSLLTLSGHKVHGPKGVGALFVRRKDPRVELSPLQRGGSQEQKLRAGTPNLPAIVGMVKAAQLAYQEMDIRNLKTRGLRDLLWADLKKSIPCIVRNGSTESTLPHNLNMSIPGIDGSALFGALKGVAVSNASSCLNGIQDYSQVLTELGLSKSLAKASLRFGLSHLNTEEEILSAAREVAIVVTKLRDLERNFDQDESYSERLGCSVETPQAASKKGAI